MGEEQNAVSAFEGVAASDPAMSVRPSSTDEIREDAPTGESTNRTAFVSDTRELRPTRIAASGTKPSRANHRRVRMRPSSIPEFDPIERLRSLSRRENRIGMTLGLAGALLVHGAGAAHSLSSLLELGAFSTAVRNAVLEDVRATYAVEVAKPPPPPPPPPEAEPPKPEPVQRAPSQPTTPAEPPPAPAQAGKVLTAEADPTEPLESHGPGLRQWRWRTLRWRRHRFDGNLEGRGA
ncbi:MAG: hypothetical protein QM784_14130 [Polyangiaceae bacterium]